MNKLVIPQPLRWLPKQQVNTKLLPVPFVAIWEREKFEFYLEEPTDEDYAGHPLLMHRDLRRHGLADFTEMSQVRQRAVVLGKRCQVCRTTLRRSYVVDRGHRVTSPGPCTGEMYFIEPPMCKTCIRFVFAHCPGVHRKQLQIYLMHHWQVAFGLVKPMSDDDPMFAPLRPRDFPEKGAVGYLKILPQELDPVALDEL